MWRPKNYYDYLESLSVEILEGGSPGYIQLKERKGKYGCDSCGVYVNHYRLVDCRSLSIQYDWVCDGCSGLWRKHGVAIDGGPPSEDRTDWLERWVAAHGAPQDIKNHVAQKRRQPIIRRKLKGKKVRL